MLRTKKAIGNIRAYIMDNCTPENYTDNPPKDFPGVAAFILDTFRITEPEAERRLTWLIYRELSKAAAKREVKK